MISEEEEDCRGIRRRRVQTDGGWQRRTEIREDHEKKGWQVLARGGACAWPSTLVWDNVSLNRESTRAACTCPLAVQEEAPDGGASVPRRAGWILNGRKHRHVGRA